MKSSRIIAICAAISISLVMIESSSGAEWWDSDFNRRKQITIDVENQALTAGEWTDFLFDHKHLVSEGKSLSEGEDIRIIYCNGDSHVELYRILDDDSSWNATSTKIWFKTQATIAAGSNDAGYYLYYDSPDAGSPPVDYEMEDDFEEWKALEAEKAEEAARRLEEARREAERKAKGEARLKEEMLRQEEIRRKETGIRKEELRDIEVETAMLVKEIKNEKKHLKIILTIGISIVLALLIFAGTRLLLFKPVERKRIASPGFKARELAERLNKAGTVKRKRKDLFKKSGPE